MDLFEAIAKRASVRAFQPVHIPDDHLERILDAGRRAPSGNNRQPFDFIVIRDPVTLKKLAEAQACIAQASLAIAIVADPSKSQYWLEDVAAATENMLLAITALGYASVWIEGTLLRKEEQLKPVLQVPPQMRLIVLLPIGAPAAEPAQASKRPLSDMVHWERYGRRR